MEYEDFEIRIDRGRDDAYSVAVRSLAGEDDASMRFPFSPAELEQQLRNLGLAPSPEDEASNQNQPPSFVADSTVRVFGTALFQALLPDGLYALYAQSETIAADDEKRLRIVLRIQAPELVGVPWEIVHNPHRRSFLALSPDASVVRYLETPSPRPRLRGAAPLRVLGVAARPNDLVTLDTSSEQCYIEAALGRLQDEGQVALRWLASQTWRDLQDELSGGHWHVVHFIGHGGFDSLDDEGFIVLVDEENQTRWLTADELGMLLEGRRSIRLVVLNACEGGRSSGRDLFSSVAATLGRVGIPAVVAMQHPIRDSAAIEFSRTFYRRLARPTPIDEAMVDARQALRVALRGTVAWATPVLYMRAEDAYILVPNADAREGAVAARPPQPAPTTPLVAPPPEPQKPPATEATAPEPAKPVPQRARARKSAPEPKAAAAEKPTPAPKRRQRPAASQKAPAEKLPAAKPSRRRSPPRPPRTEPLALQFDGALTEHHGRVTSVAFSPDGSLLASGSDDMTALLWQVSDGTVLEGFEGHTGHVRSVAFSPDAQALATGSADNTIRIWPAGEIEATHVYADHTGGVNSIAFAPDSKYLASGADDNTIRVWPVDVREPAWTLEGHTNSVESVAFSPDGRLLASGSQDATVRVWEVASGKLVHTLRGYPGWFRGGIYAVAFSPDGTLLAAGSSERSIILWDVNEATVRHTLEGHTDWIRTVAFSPDGQILASGSDDKTVRLWRVSDGRHLRTLEGHTDWVRGVAISPDGKILASASNDKTIRIWRDKNP